MTEAVDWASFDTSGFVKFAEIGDKAEGVITAVRVGTDFNELPCPVLDIETADGPRTISCGQAALKGTIRELGAKGEVRVGRHISVTYTGDVPAAKGKKKVFDIKITDGADDSKPPY